MLQTNSARVNARLKARRGDRAIVLSGLEDISKRVASSNTSSNSNKHDLLGTRLRSLCRHLQSHTVTSKSDASVQRLKDFVRTCHHFWAVPGSESTYDMLVQAGVNIDETQGNPHLLQVAKIAAYEHISRVMVRYASAKKI